MPAAPSAPTTSAPAPTPSAARPSAPSPKPVSPQAVAARAAASKPPIDLNAATGSGTRQQVAPPKTEAAPTPKVRVPGAESDEFEAAFAKLQDTVGGRNRLPDEARPNQPHKPEPQPQDDADTDLDDGTQPDADPTKEAEDPKDQEDKKPSKTSEKKGKSNPWDLVEKHRTESKTLRLKLAEYEAKEASGELPRAIAEKVAAIEKRNGELENEIGFVNYSKSKEFIENYQKPYEGAWRDALASLNGLRISYQHPETGDTVAREITPTDIAALANLDPSAARAEIRQRFPDDYAEVKSHVDKIRSLANAQNERLKEQQSKGGEWQKQQQEQVTSFYKQLAESNAKEWRAANDEFAGKYEFLKPIDGEDERNTRLERAIAFVDEAMNTRANDPAMPAEARKKAIRAHAAIRNRAIAFSTLSHENKSLKGKVAELEKALADYQSSTPGNGEGGGKEAMALEPNGADGAFDAWMAGRGKR